MFSSVGKKMLILLAGLVVIAVGVAIATSGATKKPVDASFVAAVEQQDAVKSYSYFSAAQQSTLTAAAWKEELAQINSVEGANKFVKRSASSSSDSFVYYDVTVGSQKYVLSVGLVNEAGTKKIENVAFEAVNPAQNTYQQAQKENE